MLRFSDEILYNGKRASHGYTYGKFSKYISFQIEKTGGTKFAFLRKKVLFDCSVFFMHNQIGPLHPVCPVVFL
jgi:hypothetical protein